MQKILQTKLTEKIIGLQLPIIQAPMAGGATTPELVAAASNAGALGSLGAGYMQPLQIREAIKKIRALTHKPFAVNLFIPEEHHATTEQMQRACDVINHACAELNITIQPLPGPYTPSFEEQMNVLIEEKIPVFSFTFGSLALTWIKRLQQNGTILIGTATTVAEAHHLEEQGINIIVAQGSEAGGHRGTFLGKEEDGLIPLKNLLSQLKGQINIPIIAAGGIMDGKGIAGVLNLGAAGVQMGTAFLTCAEAGIPKVYKQTLLAQQNDNTMLTCAFSGKLARGISNKFIDIMEEKKINILPYPIQNTLTMPMRQKAKEINNVDFMSMWAGQAAKFCRDITVAELINVLVKEIVN